MIFSQGCRPNAEPGTSKFAFPIYVDHMYPSGNFPIKWRFWERLDSGEEKEIACFLFSMGVFSI